MSYTETRIYSPTSEKALSVQSHGSDRAFQLLQHTRELTLSRQSEHVLITIHNRSKGNALSVRVAQQLKALYEHLSQDPSVSTITLTAEGKYFCTGMDLAEQLTADPEVRFDAFYGLFKTIDSSTKTTIAAINGPAFGGGVALAFCCDIRIMVGDAFMRLPEVKLGLCPVVAAEYVVREWGTSLARMAMLSACDVSAKTLHRVGAVHEVVDSAGHLEGAMQQWQSRLGAAVPQAIAWCKDVITLVRSAEPGGPAARKHASARRIFKAMMEQTSKSGARFAKFKGKASTESS